MPLNDEQIERYSRHILLKEIGVKGQNKLLKAKVLIIGAGGLGCPAALYLAAAGVGTIGIADADVVDLSNLQRQIAHGTADIGTYKVDSVKASINAINPDVNVITYNFSACNLECCLDLCPVKQFRHLNLELAIGIRCYRQRLVLIDQ